MLDIAADHASIEFTVFGATGDLSVKKLFPALFQLFVDKSLPRHFFIKAVTRTNISKDVLARKLEKTCLALHSKAEHFQNFLALIELVQVDAKKPDSFQHLSQCLRPDALNIYYFAVSPDLYGPLAQGLAQSGSVDGRARVVVEKPIGHSLDTARKINQALTCVFKESQIFRIDHYLGKETVQNIMALRFGNVVLEPLWCADRIQYIQITVAESIGVDDRGEYYDNTGALRDMVQNHLLQLLCVVTMEPPVRLNPYAVRDEKLKVLYSLRPILPADVVAKTVRGQYGATKKEKSYLQEAGVNPNSQTETFVALKAEIDNWRWAGMPVYLRTGKKLHARRSEIIIQFKGVPHNLFQNAPSSLLANRLVISLQPEESIRLCLNSKTPGRGMRLEPVTLNLDLASSSKQRRWDAYERLILDVIQGDLTLFMREKDVSAAWSWIDPIIAGWEKYMPNPEIYEPGGWGPVASDQLLARDGYIWRNPA